MNPDWIAERLTVERITLVGPMEESKNASSWLYENSYHTIRSGPYTDREMYPKANIGRFLIIAEREVEKE